MPSVRNGQKRCNFWMPQELHDWIVGQAEALGVPMSAYLVMTLQQVRKEEELKRGFPEWLQQVRELEAKAALRSSLEGK